MVIETRMLSREQAEELSWNPVAKTFSRLTRWEVWWDVVYEDDGRLFRFELNQGATEMQECDWPEVFEAVEVEAHIVERTEYVDVV